jgi:hypothetical protein
LVHSGLDKIVSVSDNPTTKEHYLFGQFALPVEDPVSSGQYYSDLPVVVWDEDFTTSRSETLRFPHPTTPADPDKYAAHLLNVREPIPGSPYNAYQRVIKQRFVDPDRNGDGQSRRDKPARSRGRKSPT